MEIEVFNFGRIRLYQCPWCFATWDYPEGLAVHYGQPEHREKLTTPSLQLLSELAR